MFCFAPFDTLKTRLQLAVGSGGGNALQVATRMVHQEGIWSLYSGLSAGVSRQVVYGGARMGLFDVFQELQKQGGRSLSFWQNAQAALAAGAIAACVANPADVSLIRMQADATLPTAQRQGYRHVGHALVSILRDDGPRGLLAGIRPTIVRAMAANFGSLTFNASSKEWLHHAGVTGNFQLVSAALIGGLASSVLGMPFDFIKTQMQKQAAGAEHKSTVACFLVNFKSGGLMRFYTGFPIYLMRIAPFQALALLIRDKLKQHM